MAWGPFNAGGGGGSSGGTAADISYDNSKSGISAANVQEAIDALSVLTLTIQAVPAQSGNLTYTGSTQSPTWKGYDSSMMTIGGVTSGINAGTYTATFTPVGKYVWTDGTQEAKSVSWTIGRAEIKNVPAQTGSVTYNGSAQSPAWSNYNSSQLTIGGNSRQPTLAATAPPLPRLPIISGRMGRLRLRVLRGRSERRLAVLRCPQAA